MRSFGLLFFFFCLGSSSFAGQQQFIVSFVPVFGSEPLLAEQPYKTSGGDSVVIEELKFYVSSVALFENAKLVWQEQNSFHLLDLTQASSMSLSLQLPAAIQFDELQFNLGIDSITNVSGALGGDLDPALGMYWSWQSGYINAKIEGRSNRCPARKNRFQFHLGGYAGSHKAVQKISLPAHAEGRLEVQLSLNHFLSGIDWTTENEIMIPGKEAIALSKRFAESFKITGQ